MRQTLCYIPETLFGLPLFGWGLGLGLLLLLIALSHCYQYARHRKTGDVGGSIVLLIIGGAILLFVLPNLAEPERGIPIRGYGMCLFTAIIAAFLLAFHLAKRQNIDTEKLYSLGFWAIISGFIGARLFYVTEYWQEIFWFNHEGQLLLRESLVNVLNFFQGGLVVLGSIFGGALGAFIFMRCNKMPVLRTFDILVPAMALGSAIGRIGCLLNGCCFGCVTDVPWGIVFPPGSLAHAHQIARHDVFYCGLKFDEKIIGGKKVLVIAAVQPGSEAESLGLKPKMPLRSIAGWTPQTRQAAVQLLLDTQRTTPGEAVPFEFYQSSDRVVPHQLAPAASEVLPVHPTQIYSSILALLLCGTLVFLGSLRFYQRRAGLVFASFLILYSVGRFLIEFVRTDEDSFFGTGLTISQNVSILVCLAGIVLFVYVVIRLQKPCSISPTV